jgi:aspartyl-tRNA(Asn)/glutamyl-tRNA(Gln) amidotransferase subunit A
MSEEAALNERSAIELAESVRSGAVTATQVLEAHLASIAERDPGLNAFNLVTADHARSQAEAIDHRIAQGLEVGPLAGVPVAIKDNMCTADIDTTCSSNILKGWRPPYNATVIARLSDAGAVMVGKTNLDEFAMGSTTENSAFGPTRNPIDPNLVPGGSSGGSAVAVAANMAPIALGSDTGGSIRLPASFCGVVGVKPTYGRVSRLGLVAYGSSLDQIGPFGRSVADAARVLEVIGGHDPGDSTSIPEAMPSISSHLDDGVDGFRVGVLTEMMGEGIDPEVAARIRAAADALAAQGAEIVEVSVPSISAGLSAYYIVAPAEASSNLSRYDGVRYGNRVDAPTTGEMMERTRTAGFGAEVKRRIMLGTYALSAGYYDALYGKALKVRSLLRSELETAYAGVDIMLSPVAPTTAFPLGAKAADPLTMYLTDICTITSNMVGHPAMSVPFGLSEAGLPIGVQIWAPALGEIPMFRTAAVVEAAARAQGASS